MFQGQVYAIKYNTRSLFETIGLTLSVYDLGFYLIYQSNSNTPSQSTLVFRRL